MPLDKQTSKRLRGIFGKDGVETSATELMFYEYDASLDRGKPAAVVFPQHTEQVVQLVQLAAEQGIPLVPRGAGTNLSGGSVPMDRCIVVAFSRMNQILHIDYESLRAVVQPGVVNLDLNQALGERGCFYPPDPASQKVSTLGGNTAENAGGPHCLKYGVTSNYVLGLEVVLADGTVARLGGPNVDSPGYDLIGLLVGSEGTLGIVTEITVRILRKPEAVKTMLAIFETLDDAANAVSGMIAGGIVPTTLEMMDRAVIDVVEKSFHCGYPLDAGAVLIIEVDGLSEALEPQAARIGDICRQHRVREVRVAKDAADADRLWQGRRGALSALARISPRYLTVDGVVPRTALPRVMLEVVDIAEKRGLKVANVCHAGDGNLHPFICFDRLDQAKTVLDAAMEMLRVCVDAGGTITGEHGVGLEKREAMSMVFDEHTMAAMKAVRRAFDPAGVMNPGKMLA